MTAIMNSSEKTTWTTRNYWRTENSSWNMASDTKSPWTSMSWARPLSLRIGRLASRPALVVVSSACSSTWPKFLFTRNSLTNSSSQPKYHRFWSEARERSTGNRRCATTTSSSTPRTWVSSTCTMPLIVAWVLACRPTWAPSPNPSSFVACYPW